MPPEDGAAPKLVRSQTLYVPAYSHIYYRNAERSMNLATTLSIRNTSRESPIILSTVDYYDNSGERVRGYLDTTRVLDPLASTHVVVDVAPALFEAEDGFRRLTGYDDLPSPKLHSRRRFPTTNDTGRKNPWYVDIPS